MNATAVSRLISLIPDRSPRAQTGSVYSPSEAAACRYPDRMSYMGKFLHWLGPLDPMTKEDQQILGVRTSGGRPMIAGEDAVKRPSTNWTAGRTWRPTTSPSSSPKRERRLLNLTTVNGRRVVMLSWAIAFFILALIAAFFGFGGIASSAAGIAKVLLVLFVIAFVVFVAPRLSRPGYDAARPVLGRLLDLLR